MRAYVCVLALLLLCGTALSQEPTDRTILVADKNGEVLTQIRFGDDIPLRLTDQLGQSYALRAADPAKGFVELVDEQGLVVVIGKDSGDWQKRLKDDEKKELIMTIVFQVAKGIAIVVALLILRAIIKSIGKDVEGGFDRTKLLVRVTELEEELEKLKAETQEPRPST
jgi:hypothetical protein